MPFSFYIFHAISFVFVRGPLLAHMWAQIEIESVDMQQNSKLIWAEGVPEFTQKD